MGTGYPGSGFFEKMGNDLPEGYLDYLRDNSTEEENEETKKTLLTKLDELLELQYKLVKELTDDKS